MLWHGPATDRHPAARSRPGRMRGRRRSAAPPGAAAGGPPAGEPGPAEGRHAGARRPPPRPSACASCASRSARRASRPPSPARCGWRCSPAASPPPPMAASRATTPPRGAPPASSPARARNEMRTVLGTVDHLAAVHLLDPGRLRPMFLVLRRNTQFWTHAAFPAASARTTFGNDPAVFQYYPGRGLQLQALASWGKANWLAGECLRRRYGAAARPRARRPGCGGRSTGCSRSAPQRGDFIAWEYYFSWGGGTPPWISGMTQATAVSALARAARALDVPRWRKAAHRALGAFRRRRRSASTAGTTSSCTRSRRRCACSTASCRRSAASASSRRCTRRTGCAGALFRRGERTARADRHGVGHRRLVVVLARRAASRRSATTS